MSYLTFLTLQVYGTLLQGSRAVYSYPLKAPITTDAEANRAAGDFQDVLDWRLIEFSSEVKRINRNSRQVTETTRTLRGFRNGMTPQRFAQMANG